MKKYEDDDDVVFSMEVVVEGKENNNNNNYNNIVKKVNMIVDNKEEGPYLVWEEITVVVGSSNINNNMIKPRRNKLLNNLSGYAKPNRIMALMGPSGSGKSTLLDAFSGRLSSNTEMIGNVHIKGKKQSTRNCGGISYLTQEDVFLGTLTVRETITYSAHLRVSNKMSKEEIENLVEKTIEEMGLEHCADNKIGNWYFRGISGGEKKRLSIGLEILTQPQIMLLDEPTTGLDSASAFFVVCTLGNIAHNGRIVVCSIHQPSGYLFDLFDDLYLLSGGEAVYFGDAKSAVKFFAEAGFPCPTRANPTDHFLRCVNSDFDNISTHQSESTISVGSLSKMTTQDIKEILIHKYNNSKYATFTRDNIQRINSTEEVIVLSNKSKSSWWKQMYTLTDRSFVNMRRDVGYYWLRMVFYLGVAVCTGIIYYNINTSYLDIIARAKCQAFVYGFMICLSNGGLPSFIEEIKVYNGEMLKNHYGASVVMISNFISSFPFLLVTAISTGTIIYEMVKLHPGFSHYSYFVLNLFCCLSVIETLMMVVAFMVPNVLMGIGLGTGLIVFMMMASEIFRPICDLPKFFWRYPMSYISFASWALQGVYKNDMIGIEFDPLVGGNPKLKGEMILQTMFGMPLDHSKWWDLAALVCLLISHRLILVLVLKYKDTISLHTNIYLNKVFHQISKRRSSSSSSLLCTQQFNVSKRKNHQTLYPLSCQLDLASPIRPS
ncbi:ABC transporter G family member 15 isoform X2 [Cannabis sativa]|uniref:ABC transporter G family member 15 isoform X2 n=1 Tax=Cannabis sativa TaxID=3483 RepID=UPI0029CA6B66|nr:ABC transporter G family member 15 isoform X2 [Cannabis sativa]